LCEQDIALSEIKSAMIEHGHSPLMTPAQVIIVESLPKLGTGKTDFSQAKHIASNPISE